MPFLVCKESVCVNPPSTTQAGIEFESTIHSSPLGIMAGIFQVAPCLGRRLCSDLDFYSKVPASLLCVLLSVPLSHPAICPSVLVSTHLSLELLELGALDSSAGL